MTIYTDQDFDNDLRIATKIVEEDERKKSGAKKKADEKARRTITAGCLVCGFEMSRPQHDRTTPTTVIAAHYTTEQHGKLHGQFCVECTRKQNKLEIPSPVALVGSRLSDERPGWLPNDYTLKPHHVPGLTYSGVVLTARDAGETEPNPGDAFWYLPNSIDKVVFGPEPVKVTRPQTVNPRDLTLDDGCVFCGMPASGSGFQFDHRSFGLADVREIPSRVTGFLCPDDREAWQVTAAVSGQYHYVNIRADIHVAEAITRRLRELKPSAVEYLGGGFMAPSTVRMYTWGSRVIRARESNKPVPDKPSKPFGFITEKRK